MTKSQIREIETAVATVSGDLSAIIERPDLQVAQIHTDPSLVRLIARLRNANVQLVEAADILEELAK